MFRKQLPLIAGISLTVAAVYVSVQLFLPVDRERPPVEMLIKEGMNFRQATSMLAQKNLIRDAALFKILGRLTRADKHLMPGYYSIDGSMTPWQIFRLFRDGDYLKTEVTVIEGDCLEDIRAKFAAKGLIKPDEFDKLTHDKSFIESLGVDAPSLEGYIFPDTYRFPKGISPKRMIEMMVERLFDTYNGQLSQRANELGLSMNSVITLASIIEKEAAMDFERPLISAVFYNRLKKGMPLQADPTAAYGLEPPHTPVSSWDIKQKTKYNTYKIRGLPPGPIASPGLQSIRAALYPAKVPYLYFVSNYDGTHTFSVTYLDHRRAIENARLKLEASFANGTGKDEK